MPEGTGGRPWLHIDYQETSVVIHATELVKGTGQGRELIERALPYQLKAVTSFNLSADGVHCTISVPFPKQLIRANEMNKRSAPTASLIVEDEYMLAYELRAAILDVNLGAEFVFPVAEKLVEQQIPFCGPLATIHR